MWLIDAIGHVLVVQNALILSLIAGGVMPLVVLVVVVIVQNRSALFRFHVWPCEGYEDAAMREDQKLC